MTPLRRSAFEGPPPPRGAGEMRRMNGLRRSLGKQQHGIVAERAGAPRSSIPLTTCCISGRGVIVSGDAEHQLIAPAGPQSVLSCSCGRRDGQHGHLLAHQP